MVGHEAAAMLEYLATGSIAVTIVILRSLEQKLVAEAQQRNVSPEALISEALHWYLQLDPNVLDELSAWQEIRDEALLGVKF